MPDLDLDLLLAASSPGGATCLTSVTELAPAAGPHAAVAPVKFALRGRDGGAYAYEKRYLLPLAYIQDSAHSTYPVFLTTLIAFSTKLRRVSSSPPR